METSFPGQLCKDQEFSLGYLQAVDPSQFRLTKGIALEIYKYAKKTKSIPHLGVPLILKLQGLSEETARTSGLIRKAQIGLLRLDGKRQNVRCRPVELKLFLNETLKSLVFPLSESHQSVFSGSHPPAPTSVEVQPQQHGADAQPHSPDSVISRSTLVPSDSALSTSRSHSPVPSPVKRANVDIHLLRTQITTLRKEKTMVESNVQKSKISLEHTRLLESECKSKNNNIIKNLKRQERRRAVALQKAKVELKRSLDKQSDSQKNLQAECARNQESNEKIHYLENRLEELKKKVVKLQKSLSSKKTKESCSSHDPEINDSQNECDTEECDTETSTTLTRDHKGTFLPFVRECVLELLSCEVSSENVAKVIQSVVKHFVGEDIPINNLPCRQTVLNISDSVQVLLHTMYADEIKEATSFGIKKDGTTRQKKKILTSSITLNDGKELPLGFHHVARETGETIMSSVKEKLMELEAADKPTDNKPTDFLTNMLQKLSYFMSDRAANEGKADRMLEQWRAEVLQETTEDEVSAVHSFHCMAHALLGFVYHANTHFVQLQAELDSETIKLGREALAMFFRWKKDFAPKRATRTACEILGPMCDEKNGIRDKWLAYCRSKSRKSVIPFYKDNRFNAVFECAACILFHRDDIIDFLDKLETQNLKVQSVNADLKDARVSSMIHAFAILYVKVTGPYWDMSICNTVDYLSLGQLIQPLAASVEHWLQNPDSILLLDDQPVFQKFPPNKDSPLWKAAVSPPTDIVIFRRCLLCILAGMKKCIEMQLKDFLPGGKYGDLPAEDDTIRVQGSGINNLACERAFGSLDASQTRRRHASMHFHSTIVMLKKGKGNLTKWMSSKNPTDRQTLWKTAGKQGRLLRAKHRTEELEQLRLQEDDLEAGHARKKKKADKTNSKRAASVAKKTTAKQVSAKNLVKKARGRKKATTQHEDAPEVPKAKQHDWVAVAFENGWYPGQVLKCDIDEIGSLMVNFLHPSTLPGQFKYPSPPDTIPISPFFVFACPLQPPEPKSGGRLFNLGNYSGLQHQFNLFRKRVWNQ